MFGELEEQRDQLKTTVNALRAFEAAYRSNLTAHLQSQIEVLASGSEEPADPPAALSAPVGRSNGAASTPANDERTGGSTEQQAAVDGDGVPVTGGSDTPRLDALLGDQR
jgi:hypothetical protein